MVWVVVRFNTGYGEIEPVYTSLVLTAYTTREGSRKPAQPRNPVGAFCLLLHT